MAEAVKETKVPAAPAPLKKKKKVGCMVGIGILIIIIGLIAWMVIRNINAAKEALIPVDTFETLAKQDIESTVSLSGKVESNQSQQLSAPTALKVLTLNVKAGDKVTAGQVLATLDTTEVELQIRSAELNIENAENSKGDAARANGSSQTSANNAVKSAAEDVRSAKDSYDKQKDKVDAQGEELGAADTDDYMFTVDENGKGTADMSDRLAQQVVQAKIDLDAAQRAYDDLVAQDGNTAQVISARKDLEAAQRAYDDDMSGASSQYNLEKARIEVENAQQRVADAQTQGNAAIQTAQIAVDSARLAASAAYDAAQKAADAAAQAAAASSNSTYTYTNPYDDPSYQSALRQIDQAQVSLNSAITTRDSNVAAAQKALETAQIAYNQVLESADKSKLNSRDALDKAQASYDNALKSSSEATRQAADTLDKAQANYQNALQAQKDSLDTAESSLRKAEIQYNTAQSNRSAATSQNMDTAENGVALQEISLERLQQQLTDSVLIAPFSGTVTRCDVTVGQIATGVMFVIEDTDDIIVDATVNEYDVGTLQDGQIARIQTDSSGTDTFMGSISRIGESALSSAAGTTTGSVVFTVNLKFDKLDPRVKIGMNAQVVVVTGERKGTYAVPYTAIITRDGKTYIAVKDTENTSEKDKRPATREIEVTQGLETDRLVEIISPELHDGLEVVVSTSDPAAELAAASGMTITEDEVVG